MLLYYFLSLFGAATVFVGINLSRAFWDNRHYTDVVLVKNALERHNLFDHAFILVASNPTDSTLNLQQSLHRHWPPSVRPSKNPSVHINISYIPPHELTPERLLRFLASDLWTQLPKTPIDVLVLYFAGHGSPNTLKLQDLHFLYKGDLERVLLALKSAGMFSHLCLLVDSCHAASFIDILRSKEWYVGVGSSLADESSYSIFINPVTGIPRMDRFSLALSSADLSAHGNFSALLAEEVFNHEALMSHAVLAGNSSLWFRRL